MLFFAPFSAGLGGGIGAAIGAARRPERVLYGVGRRSTTVLVAPRLAPGVVEWRAQIGFLAPADHLYENLTVEENLRFFSALYKRNGSASAIGQALEAIGLAPRAGELVSNLSSGMKCRLSIAKWQLLQPGLLLLDEPYGVLDGKGVDLLESFLQAHSAQGNLVVMASHHVSRALKLCNRAVILHQGRLSFDEAKQQPWPSFARAFSDFLPQGEIWNS